MNPFSIIMLTLDESNGPIVFAGVVAVVWSDCWLDSDKNCITFIVCNGCICITHISCSGDI